MEESPLGWSCSVGLGKVDGRGQLHGLGGAAIQSDALSVHHPRLPVMQVMTLSLSHVIFHSANMH